MYLLTYPIIKYTKAAAATYFSQQRWIFFGIHNINARGQQARHVKRKLFDFLLDFSRKSYAHKNVLNCTKINAI